jgi:hypothetical protein
MPHPDQLLSQVPDIPAGSSVFGRWNFAVVNDQDMQGFHEAYFF